MACVLRKKKTTTKTPNVLILSRPEKFVSLYAYTCTKFGQNSPKTSFVRTRVRWKTKKAKVKTI